jgi:hypothetical protein
LLKKGVEIKSFNGTVFAKGIFWQSCLIGTIFSDNKVALMVESSEYIVVLSDTTMPELPENTTYTSVSPKQKPIVDTTPKKRRREKSYF